MLQNQTPVSYSVPDQFLPESKKDREWYLQNVRYFSTFYNRPFTIFAPDKSNDNMTLLERLSPVEQMTRAYSYVLGKQDNNGFVSPTSTSAALQAPLINGQKIPVLVQNMVGSMEQYLENTKIGTQGISKDIRNKKIRRIQLAILRRELDDFYKELEGLGVYFNPITSEIALDSEEDIKSHVERTPQDYAEIIAQRIADKMSSGYFTRTDWSRKFRDTVIAGLTASEIRVENGRTYLKSHHPRNVIWDNSITDDFNKRKTFIGYIEFLTPVEVIAKYRSQLDETEIKEIESMSLSANSMFMNIYNNAPTFNWYSFIDAAQTQVNKIACVTMYWYTMRDTKYKKREVKYKGKEGRVEGDELVKKVTDGDGDYYVKDICKATTIGNKYLVDYGYVPNLLEEYENPGNPVIPMYLFVPNMELDQYRSVVSRLSELQDDITMLAYKIRETAYKAKGKVYLINGSKFGLTNPQEFFSDIEANNIHVTTGTSGEAGDRNEIKGEVQLIDWTLDPNIMNYVQLKKMWEMEMEEIASIPKTALGQAPAYIGKQVQQQQLQQSQLGLTTLYNGFITHLEMVLNHAVNVQARVWFYTDGAFEVAEDVIGDDGVAYLKEVQGKDFPYFGVSIKFGDLADPQSKAEINSLLQAYLQNNDAEAMLTALKIRNAKTMVDAENDLEYFIKKRKKEMQEQQQQQFQQQMMMQQAQQQAETDIATMKEVANTDRAEQANNTKLATQALSSAVSMQQPSQNAEQP